MSGRPHTIHLHLREETIDYLRARAEELGIDPSALVRAMVRAEREGAIVDLASHVAADREERTEAARQRGIEQSAKNRANPEIQARREAGYRQALAEGRGGRPRKKNVDV